MSVAPFGEAMIVATSQGKTPEADALRAGDPRPAVAASYAFTCGGN